MNDLSNQVLISEAAEAKTMAEAKRIHIIRQDRIEVQNENCFISFGNAQAKVVNISPFGLAVECSSDMSTPEAYDIPLIFNDFELSRLHLKKIRSELDHDGQFLIALEVMGEPIKMERLHAVKQAQLCIERELTSKGKISIIPPELRRLVLELREALEQMQKEVKEQENYSFTLSPDAGGDFAETFSAVMGEEFNKNLPALYSEMEKLLCNFPSEITQAFFQYFRDRVGELIYQAPFADRVYHKPLKYAGDYEMMNILYRNTPEGASLFAKCLHKYFVERPAGKAVRNRADYLLDILKSKTKKPHRGESIHILSVASGPAMEIQRLIEQAEQDSLSHVHFYLLDQDVDSLKHAQRKIIEKAKVRGLTVNLHLIKQDMKRVIVAGVADLPSFDLVYSAGLFDYFSDPVAMMAGQKLFQSVKSGGELIIGNFGYQNPDMFGMDLVLDWQLIYRSADDMHRLFGHLNGDVTVASEGLGINLFCRIKKT